LIGWIDMVTQQPAKGQRILARWAPSLVFRQWGIKDWKPMPLDSNPLTERRLKFGQKREEL
jgi:hypothetical protein